ncbi:MAG: DNA polymerase III subunit delta' [Planctomycetota bacterium]|jgi:DNA polymerase-3 subunit delta'
MSFEAIKGQEEAVENLAAALSSGRVAQALLLVGPEGVGKRLAATEVARALLCADGPRQSCGDCPPCRRVANGTHCDLYIVSPEDGRASITIAQARDLGARVAESPLEGLRKVAIIDPADSLTTEAQNALLKTLEEPPADTTIILCAENAESLLPTVRSRCRRVAFKPVADRFIAEFLISRDVAADAAETTARVAGGSFARAARLVDEKAAQGRRELLAAVSSAAPDEPRTLFEILAGGKRGSLRERRQSAISRLETLHLFLVDCVRAKGGGQPRTNFDFSEEIARFARERTVEELTDLEKYAADGIIMLSMNADIRLVAERTASRLVPGLKSDGA